MKKLLNSLGLLTLLAAASCSDSESIEYAMPSPDKAFDVVYSKITHAGLNGKVDDCVRVVKHGTMGLGTPCDVMGTGFRLDAVTWKTHEDVSMLFNGGTIAQANKTGKKVIGDKEVGVELLHNNEPL